MPPTPTMAPAASFSRNVLLATRGAGVFRCQSPWAAVIPTGRRAAHIPRASKMAREVNKERSAVRGATEPSVSTATKLANEDFFKSGATPLFPGTFIAAPWSDIPKNPTELLTYQWLRIKTWVTSIATVLNIKFQSMPGFTKRPRWKAHRGRIPPTAKAMYASMLEAFAAGDKQALRRLCTPNFAEQLTGAIDRRNRAGYGVRIGADFRKSLFYPGLRSHMISQYNPHDTVTLTEQAVVALASTQNMNRYVIATGQNLKGSTKVQKKIEYVVLQRTVNSLTYEKTDWQIWGTTAATTLGKYKADEEAMAKEQATKAGW